VISYAAATPGGSAIALLAASALGRVSDDVSPCRFFAASRLVRTKPFRPDSTKAAKTAPARDFWLKPPMPKRQPSKGGGLWPASAQIGHLPLGRPSDVARLDGHDIVWRANCKQDFHVVGFAPRTNSGGRADAPASKPCYGRFLVSATGSPSASTSRRPFFNAAAPSCHAPPPRPARRAMDHATREECQRAPRPRRNSDPSR
jgi:hypothetical protein